MDSDGCIKCRCKSPQCAEVQRCAVYCEFGHEIDPITGCETCSCKRSADDISTPRPTLPMDDGRIPAHCRVRPMCAMFCPNGFRTGEDGCPICSCNPVRPVIPEHCHNRPMCRMHCETGFQTGEDGCPICRCNPPPEEVEPTLPEHCRVRPMCAMFCPNGFRTGEDGCPICSCNPVRPVIPEHCHNRPMCRMHCETGFQTGEDGCPICRCNPPPEEVEPTLPEHCRVRPMCAMFCPNGFRTGEDGCPICSCNPVRPVIPEHCHNRPMCRMHCETGFQTGEDGCPICRCNPPPEDVEPTLPEHCRVRPMCAMFCPNGFRTGEDGCPICSCNPVRPVIPEHCHNRPMCRMHCETGFQTGEDGCPICRCNSPPEEVEPTLPEHCRVRPMCAMFCPNGFRTGEDGCPICSCNPLDLPGPLREERPEEAEVKLIADPVSAVSASLPTHCLGRAMCMMYCRYGFELGDDRCPICRCRMPIEAAAAAGSYSLIQPRLAVPETERKDEHKIPEEDGDEKGVTIVRRGRCPIRRCQNICQFSYKTDSLGCRTCECNPRPRIPVPSHCSNRPSCYMSCPDGFEVDREGCPLCRCVLQNPETDFPAVPHTKPCTPMMCFVPCLHGSRLHNGCPTCDCLPPPRQTKVELPKEEERALEEHEPEVADILRSCPRLRCLMECRWGYQLDSNGCETCRCLPPPESVTRQNARESTATEGGVEAQRFPSITCREIGCLLHCPFGHKSDQNGCRTCECLPDPCPAVRCLMNCPFGYERDSQGCQTCGCRDYDHIPNDEGEETKDGDEATAEGEKK